MANIAYFILGYIVVVGHVFSQQTRHPIWEQFYHFQMIMVSAILKHFGFRLVFIISILFFIFHQTIV